MKKSKRDKIRVQIEEEQMGLEQKIHDLRELTKPISPENAIGRVSRMDAINNKSVNEAALKAAEQKLKKLNFALTKIDSEDFGRCINCGNDIQEGRLMFMPESAYCVGCASR